jgi:cell division protein FtsZ
MPHIKPDVETFAKIKVIGVGGSGGSAVDRMVRAGIAGIEFVVMNTDVQALHHNAASRKLHIGKTITRGLGAGMDPEQGKRAAEESQNDIREIVKDTDMVFITCGLGGGTGSGASPVIAQIAKDAGALTVGVVTRPFSFEGQQRVGIADDAYAALARSVDAIITIPNDRILQIIDKKTSMSDAFKIVDDVLRQGVQGISEIITVPGLINVDFADVRAIMKDTGSALMGIGIASGDDRAVEAAKAAISSPLLELSIDGARGILFTITGGANLGMQEVAEAAKIITNSADEGAKVIFGAVIDENMGDDIRITVIATGFEDGAHRFAPKREVFEDDVRSSIPQKKSFYSPTTFRKRPEFSAPAPAPVVASLSRMAENDEDEYEEEEAIPTPFISRPVAAPLPVAPLFPQPKSFVEQQRASVAAKVDEDDEEDLEIPAFLRKKMGGGR